MEPAGLHTLREIDEACGLPKGSAFRAFKRLLPGLAEGRDFLWLEAEAHAETIAALKQQGRLYPTTVNALLFSAAGRRRLLVHLGHPDA